jgi:hypothetical protein
MIRGERQEYLRYQTVSSDRRVQSPLMSLTPLITLAHKVSGQYQTNPSLHPCSCRFLGLYLLIEGLS